MTKKKATVNTRQDSETEIEKAERIAIGSPIFVRIVGAILVAITLWTGNTVYDLAKSQATVNLQITAQATSLNHLNEKVESLMSVQYSKNDALRDTLSIQTKIDALELRIRKLETDASNTGSLKDPIVQMIQSCKDDIGNLKEQLSNLKLQLNSIIQDLKK